MVEFYEFLNDGLHTKKCQVQDFRRSVLLYKLGEDEK